MFYLSDILAGFGGRLPALPPGCDNHIFISKHESAAKDVAEVIARVLRDDLKALGFKVWLSQFESAAFRPVDKVAMQAGVDRSAMVLLILTPGIFQKDRFWVTHTEIKYAIGQRKPVQLLEIGFDLNTKLTGPGGCGHLKECCEGVAPDFQPHARALVTAPASVPAERAAATSRVACL